MMEKYNYLILGAAGRLGTAFSKYLHNNQYHLIYRPDKIYPGVGSVLNIFNCMMDLQNTVIINCAGLTNVQQLLMYDENVKWVNVDLPYVLAKYSKQYGCKFYQISSDYVYRENDTSVYTQSKKDMEKRLKRTNAHIIRTANLFSLSSEDKHNIISKLGAKYNEILTVDPAQRIFPTEVDMLAKKIIEFIDSNDKRKEVNFAGPQMTVEELFYMVGGAKVVYKNSPIKFNFDKFIKNSIEIPCRQEVDLKIDIDN